MIQFGGYFCSWLSDLGKKALANVAVPLVRDNLPRLVNNLASNALNTFQTKISGKGGEEQPEDSLYLFQMKIWMISLKL